MVSGIAYVNGRISPIEAASISIEDRGLQFGDSVYEVVRIENGTFFRFAAHLDRLSRSLQAIALASPVLMPTVTADAERLLQAAAMELGLLYIQVTRGSAPRQHAFPRETRPTLIMTIRPIVPVEENLRRQGVRLISRPDLRWAYCDIKTTALIANVLAREEAVGADGFEALLYETDGTITECTAANFFAIIDGRVQTRPPDHRILNGVTRGVVLDLSRTMGIECREVPIRLADLPRATEAFITGTGIEILPVAQIDENWRRPPGPLTLKLRDAYRKLVGEETAGAKAG